MKALNHTQRDKCILEIDKMLKVITGNILHEETERDHPASMIEKQNLSADEKKHSARLMRVNYAGEVAAQALYAGQAMTARSKTVKQSMAHSAQEEIDHLIWCKLRLDELDSHVSYLNPIWYIGSLSIGVMAGLTGDEWSLGFVSETEKQVCRHLEKHLNELPKQDYKSRAIVLQMKEDEANHAKAAEKSGAKALPQFIKSTMRVVAKVMTGSAYYI